jgi:hypothetical protein
MIAGQRSPRNPLIVEVLRDFGYVDAQGMGVRTKIIPLLERDQALRSLQGPEAWKPVWRKQLHEQRRPPPLDQAFNQAVGSNAWNILMRNAKLPLLPCQSAKDAPLRFGLRHCRHKLVHGMQSPPQRELELLAPWGAEAVKRLLHQETGWPKILGWSAQTRLPGFRVARPGRSRGLSSDASRLSAGYP